MQSVWYEFIEEYGANTPYKPLSVILEAFYWYIDKKNTTDEVYSNMCIEKINQLMN